EVDGDRVAIGERPDLEEAVARVRRCRRRRPSQSEPAAVAGEGGRGPVVRVGTWSQRGPAAGGDVDEHHAGPGPAAACSGGPGGGDGGAVRGQIGGGVAQADRLRVRREVPQVAVRGDENQPGTDVVELVVPGTDRHAGVPDRVVPALAAPPAAFAVVVEVAARQDRRGGENGAVVRDGTDGQTAR